MAIVAMNPAVPGNIASSAEYNKVIANIVDLDARAPKFKEARSTGDETVTTTVTDVNGITAVSFTTYQANTVVSFRGYFDVESSGSTDIFLGTLYVDGTLITTGEAHFRLTGRATVSQEWTVPIGTAGAHLAKLRRQKTTNSDTVTLFGTHTKLIIEGNGVV